MDILVKCNESTCESCGCVSSCSSISFVLKYYSYFHSLVLKAWGIHGKAWKKHGENSMPFWIPLKTMEHGAGAKFHGFHGEISMLSMLAWNRKIVKIFPRNTWKAWNLKPWKTMESMGIYKNESMGSMVFSSILLLIISRKHGKAWHLCK